MVKKYKKLTPEYYVSNFATTTDGEDKAEVWAAATVYLTADGRTDEKRREDMEWDKSFVHIYTDLDSWLDECDHSAYTIHYFCNAKFDGSFILTELLKRGYKTQLEKSKYEMEDHEMSYIISAKGIWYSITFKKGNNLVEIRDSLKLIPAGVEDIANSFHTIFQKMEMNYSGHKPGQKMTDREREAMISDVMVLREALSKLIFEEGKNKLTIGACCLSEYKTWMGPCWKDAFPNLGNIPLNVSEYGAENADRYIRNSYRGGFCYLVEGKEGEHTDGVSVDVNGLHSYVMHSKSGNRYPVGRPVFWKGDFPEFLKRNPEKLYYFVRVKCCFKIKPEHLPWLRIEGSMFYDPHVCLKSSDCAIWSELYNDYVYYPCRWKGQDWRPTLTFTQSDWELFNEQYDVSDLTILDGCFFQTQTGLFDQYINRYVEQKANSTGARREIAKLCLNSLPGKFATSSDASFKVASLDENGALQFKTVPKRDNKRLVYIPVGSAVTSYAKGVTIRLAQQNYHGEDRPGFVYSDTDSLKCDVSIDELIGIELDDKELGKWKFESGWDRATFLKQKTYIEHVVAENGVVVDPRYAMKCAGLPKACKETFTQELESGNKTLKDFKSGLKIDGMLTPKYVEGGVTLVEKSFKIS